MLWYEYDEKNHTHIFFITFDRGGVRYAKHV